MLFVVQLLKSWEYKNKIVGQDTYELVVQLLKSWEYKNKEARVSMRKIVVQLLKSWEYKNTRRQARRYDWVVQLLKSWEYKNPEPCQYALNQVVQLLKSWEYKNPLLHSRFSSMLYSYLNLESTKTSNEILMFLYPHSDYKINNCPCQSLLSKNLFNSSLSGVWEYLIR